MNRRQADIGALAVIGGVLAVGFVAAWDAFQTRQARDGMMEHMNGFGPDPVWYVLGTLLVAGVLGGMYAVARSAMFDDGTDTGAQRPTPEVPTDQPAGGETGLDTDPGAQGSRERDRHSGDTQAGKQGSETQSPDSRAEPHSEATPQRGVLDVLPEDERRILEPVIESPGLTQTEVRDRADFSKSKVSQTVTDLEKRGLLYREPQGRTYRIYPADELTDASPDGSGD